MALPKIIQKLFSDAGKGTKLNSEIIPPLKDKTSEELFTFIGEKGELTYNTTEKRIVAHDGVTKGGIPLAKKAEVDAIDVGVTSVNGNTGDITPEQTGCLPLGGGKLTGDVASASGMVYKTATDDNRMAILGGTSENNGAILILSGKDRSASAGNFTVSARNGTNTMNLTGQPDGNLYWGGKQIVRSVNGTSADASGNVAISIPNVYVTKTWSNGTSWYRKYSDGWIEQGGYATTLSSSGTYWGESTITFPIAFSNTNYSVVATATGEDMMTSVFKRTTTGCTATANSKYGITGSNKPKGFSWCACGY